MAKQDGSKRSLTQRLNDYQPTRTMLVWASVGTAVATCSLDSPGEAGSPAALRATWRRPR